MQVRLAFGFAKLVRRRWWLIVVAPVRAASKVARSSPEPDARLRIAPCSRMPLGMMPFTMAGPAARSHLHLSQGRRENRVLQVPMERREIVAAAGTCQSASCRCCWCSQSRAQRARARGRPCVFQQAWPILAVRRPPSGVRHASPECGTCLAAADSSAGLHTRATIAS